MILGLFEYVYNIKHVSFEVFVTMSLNIYFSRFLCVIAYRIPSFRDDVISLFLCVTPSLDLYSY
jgi:hypothetical protein